MVPLPSAGPVAPARRRPGSPTTGRTREYERAMGAAGPRPYACRVSETARLRLVLERVPEEVHEPELTAIQPLIGFDAFASGQRIHGWVRLDADRLTDTLNAHLTLHLVNVLVEDLRTGTSVAADEAVVHRDALVAVRASGPRGDPSLRRDTIGHAMLVEAGPFLVGGYLHAAPGTDPLARVRGGDPMIPLTEAWIASRSGDDGLHRRFGTVIVNRHLVTRFRAVSEADLEAAATTVAVAA